MGIPIYVLAPSGKPLMPTYRHNKVWYWLRTGRAEVVRREPFTIRLKCATAQYTQAVTIGGRRLKGSFVVKDLCAGKTLLEVAPSKLKRLARPLHGWIVSSILEQSTTEKEGSNSSHP